jgi:hypothetical protein
MAIEGRRGGMRKVSLRWAFGAIGVSLAVSAGPAFAASSRAPSGAEARVLKHAETGRHHPRGTRIFAMRVSGPGDEFGAVIWRAPGAFATAARSGPKIIDLGGTDYYKGGPSHYKPGKARKELKPKRYDLHAHTEGNGFATYSAPSETFLGRCQSGTDTIRSNTSESFTEDAFGVALPGGGKVKSEHASYKGTSSSTETFGPCGSDPGSTGQCHFSMGLDPKKSGHDLRVNAWRVDFFPGETIQFTSDFCPDSISGARLLQILIGGGVALNQNAAGSGSALTQPLTQDPTTASTTQTKSCNQAGCGKPPECVTPPDAGSGDPSNCSSKYTWSGFVELFPAGY